MNKLVILSILLLLNFSFLLAQPSASCDILWSDAIFGTCIGENNNLISYDIDGDGREEIIANACGQEFCSLGYWYVLQYNDDTEGYEKIYTSRIGRQRVEQLALADVNNDGQMDLIISRGNLLEIIDLSDFTTIHSLTLPQFSQLAGVRQIHYADADNDDEYEIMVASSSRLLIYNTTNFEIEQELSITQGDFSVGNVDDDASLEIVFVHGRTIELTADGIITEEYDFNLNETTNLGSIELSDLDNDGLLEAIVAAPNNNLVVYDVDQSLPKFEILSDHGIDALTLYDLDGDGIEEILIGDNYDGYIYAHNSINGALLWEISNPSSGVTGIAVGDFDSDGTMEVAWGAGCSSSGADYFYVYNVNSSENEWRSVDIDGPFYAIEISDIDNDGDLEIITISFSSESGSYDSVLKVYDANSKNIEFQSPNNFFVYAGEGTYNLEIADYGDDGDQDIIIAGGESEGYIWVVDGSTYTIEQNHIYPWPEEINRFYNLQVNDIDDDNISEFIVVDGGQLLIINSQDFSVEYSSGYMFGGGSATGVLVANIDEDNGKEIIACMGRILRFENGTYIKTQTESNRYTAIHLFDWNNDGTLEIIGGKRTIGEIDIIDANSLEVIESITFGYNDAQGIGGIQSADFNNDGEEELIVTFGSTIIFVQRDGAFFQSQEIALNLGEYDAIDIVDYDGDGIPNILLGSWYGIIEVNPACTQCLGFEAEVIGMTELLCHDDTDGDIEIIIEGGTPPFVFQWGDGSSNNSISNLGAGTYLVEVRDSLGCMNVEEVVISSPLGFYVSFYVENDDLATAELEGSITALVDGGTPPYLYDWNNGSTNYTIDQLSGGVYTLTVTDQNECQYEATVEVQDITTSVRNFMLSEGINVYPNPNDGFFVVEVDNQADYFDTDSKYEIHSISGTLVYSSIIGRALDKGRYSFDLSCLENGTYFLSFICGNKVQIFPIVLIR